MAGIDWFRWHHGSVTDPKFSLVARKSGASLPDVLAVWAYVLEAASAAGERGCFGDVDCEALDCLFGFEDGRTALILQAMQDRKLVAGDQICAWEKRQPSREREDGGAAARKREQRQRDSEKHGDSPPSGAMSHHVTPKETESHQKKPREEESRGDKSRGEEYTHTTSLPRDTPAEASSVTKAGAVCVVLRSEGVSSVNPSHPDLLALIAAGAEVGQFSEAARTALKKKKPGFAYVLGIVRRQLEDVAAMALAPGLGSDSPPAYESGYQRSQRERVAAFAPAIAKKHPGAQASKTVTMEAAHVAIAQGN